MKKLMKGKKKLAVLVAVAVMASFVVVAMVSAAAPWFLFGDATAVKQGQGANPWAIQLRSDLSLPTPWGGVAFQQPQGGLTFADISQLSADYNVTDDDCSGGSPRFQIGIDTAGDGAVNGNIFVYFGPLPNFTGCSAGWQSTGNLIGLPDADKRYDLMQLGGTFYDTYSNALTLVGDKDVLYVALIVDSGWMFVDGEQTILVDNVKVNNYQLTGRGYRGR